MSRRILVTLELVTACAMTPAYPARLQVEYPHGLSRGLALVKWWLLAIPQCLFVGGTYAVWHVGGGLVAVLVLIAAVTGRHPEPVFDFVLGINRWLLRVAAHAALMTDRYSPFRFDMGGTDPAAPSAWAPFLRPAASADRRRPR